VARVKIRVLGTLEVRREPADDLVRLDSRKLGGLLAYLAFCPGMASTRESLATLLWDRSGSEQARASLRQALVVLRKLIDVPGEPILIPDHDRVALARDAVWVDAIEFQRLVAEGTTEALQRAMTLYRGHLLEGVSIGSSAFEDWVRAESQRLQDLAIGALAKLLAIHQEAGDFAAAVEVIHRILAIDPLHDDAHRTLILLYARQGARGEALKQYDRYRALLQRELGLEPDAATRQLVQGLHDAHRTEAATEMALAVDVKSRTGGLVAAAEPARGTLQPMGAEGPVPGQPTYKSSRRFVTLLSCTLADDVAMSARLDPEDLGRVVEAFMACCDDIVAQHHGYVFHHLDQSVSACFGYPEADEHGPERAVRAALEIVAKVGRLMPVPESRLRTRVGVSSGWVVMSERAVTGRAREAGIAGAEPHIVAALQAAAEPDSVLIAESTRTLLGTLFDCEDLGIRKLAKVAVPVQVWRVLGERPGESRFTATRGSPVLAAMIGREEELDMLRRRWQLARTGIGQVVVLAGEPGIGKSRLVEALRMELAGEPVAYLAYYCSPHHQQSTLYPVIQQLERAAGYARHDTPAVKLEKLEALLRLSGSDLSGTPLVADLLSIPSDDRYPPLNLAPQRQKEKTLEVLEAQLIGLARKQPVLMIFDDLHWSDPATREAVDRLMELVQTLPVLMVISHRPGIPIPRTGESHVTSLVLKRLGRSESRALVELLAGENALTHDVVATIAEKADGIPLFVEELTKYALATGAPGGRHLAADRLPSSTIRVPDKLHDLLVARLDTLGPAKTVAQEAAVIGRRFSYPLLEAVSSLDEPQLQSALASLVDAGLVYVHGTPPEANYRFKHALVQDAAYASLLRSDRAPLHERIALALEERFPWMAELEPEALAEHFAQAGLTERAIPYWQAAAELGLRRSAQHEAIAYIGKALKSLERLPSSTQRSGQELALQVLLGQAWMLAAGYTAPEVESAYKRAQQLGEELGDSYHLFFVLLGLWQFYIAKAQVAPARAVAERLLSLALGQDNRGFAIEAHVAQFVTLFTEGRFEEVLDHANQAIALHDPAAHHEHIRNFGYDGYVIALNGAAWANWILGYPERGLQRAREVVAVARTVAHPYSRTMALYSAAWLHLFRREAGAARELAEESIALSAEHGFVWPQAYAAPVAGWAVAEEGRPVEAIEAIRTGLAALERMGHQLWRPHQQGLLATALARAGQTEEALAEVTRALDSADRTGDVENTAELHRLKGELTLRRAGPDAHVEAEHCFRRAVGIAHRQRAKSWELRAATSLARLLREQHRYVEAREALEPLYGWFTEGLDTLDLREARALLDELQMAAAGTGTLRARKVGKEKNRDPTSDPPRQL